MPEALVAAGAAVQVHDDHFPQDALDEEWLPVVAARGWLVLTKDERIAYRALEQIAVTSSAAAVFVLVSRNLSGAFMANALVAALRRMTDIGAAQGRPFIAKVYRDGRVLVWKDTETLLAGTTHPHGG